MSPRTFLTMSLIRRRILQFGVLAAGLLAGAVLAAEPPILGAAPPERSALQEPLPGPEVQELSAIPKVEHEGTPVAASSTRNSTVFAPSFLRIEQDDPDWSMVGSWSAFTLSRASGGSYLRSSTAGNTAQITFTGTWVSLGFIGDRLSGEVEITIDSVSQGTFDLYRREESSVRLRFDGLSVGGGGGPNGPGIGNMMGAASGG